VLDYESRECNCASQMGERKPESASARGLHRLKELSLASATGGRAWGVALGVSSVLEGYLEDMARRTAFTVTLYRSGVRSGTYVNKLCKPLDLKQSDYMYSFVPPGRAGIWDWQGARTGTLYRRRVLQARISSNNQTSNSSSIMLPGYRLFHQLQYIIVPVPTNNPYLYQVKGLGFLGFIVSCNTQKFQ
jgi:hypothetical protein